MTEPCNVELQEPPIFAKLSFVRFDPADRKLPGDHNHKKRLAYKFVDLRQHYRVQKGEHCCTANAKSKIYPCLIL